MHSLPALPAPEPAPAGLRLRVSIYRYFFYAWLFRDADAGTALERYAALRHNAHQARWLPVYLFRWAVVGATVAALEQFSEYIADAPLISAGLTLCLIFVVIFQLLTLTSWAFLRASRQTPR